MAIGDVATTKRGRAFDDVAAQRQYYGAFSRRVVVAAAFGGSGDNIRCIVYH